MSQSFYNTYYVLVTLILKANSLTERTSVWYGTTLIVTFWHMDCSYKLVDLNCLLLTNKTAFMWIQNKSSLWWRNLLMRGLFKMFTAWYISHHLTFFFVTEIEPLRLRKPVFYKMYYNATCYLYNIYKSKCPYYRSVMD